MPAMQLFRKIFMKSTGAALGVYSPTRVSSFLFGRTFFVLSLALVLASMLFLNFNTPYLADDYGYALYGGKHISSLSEIALAMKEHYFSWGGRIIVHGIAQFFLWQGHTAFSIANSLVFTAVILLVLVLAGTLGDFKPNGLMVFFSFVFVAAFAPKFGQDVLWLIGSCNYLWGAFFALAALVPFADFVVGRAPGPLQKLACPIAPVLGFLAGFSSEGVGVSVIFAEVLALGVAFKARRRTSPLLMLSLAATLVGYVIMISAPGNFQRFEISQEHIEPVSSFLKVLGSYFDPEFLLYPIFMGLGALFLPCGNPSRVRCAMMATFLVLLCSTFCFTFSPTYTSRVLFFPVCTALTVILIPLGSFKLGEATPIKFQILLALLIFSAFAHVMFLAGHEATHLNRSYKSIAKAIESGAATWNTDEIIIPRKDFYSPRNHLCAGYSLMELEGDPQAPLNKAMGAYFNTKKPIKLADE